MEKKKKHSFIMMIISALVVVILAAIVVGTYIIKKYSPTKEHMDLYNYFEIDKEASGINVYKDGTQFDGMGQLLDNRLYLEADFIASYINVRFYYDVESNSILYATADEIKELSVDQRGADVDYSIVKKQANKVYIAWDYVAERTDCDYVFAKDPDRLIITTSYEPIKCADISKKGAVRYRGGIKSPILEDVSKGTRVQVLEDLEDWIKVKTSNGVVGYIQPAYLGEEYDYTREPSYTEDYRINSFGEKINMAWFQVGGVAGNDSINSLYNSSMGLNVISPTWYSITDSKGGVSCYASSAFVNNMHKQGIEVWPLIDDFNDAVDYDGFFKSKQARSNLINRLISDSSKYGFDGINLDFENVNKDNSKDFLEFVRELAIECRRAGIKLSSDSYKPEAYNSCYNLKEQAVFVDYIVLMAYDEHYAGSSAGSVSSLKFVKDGIEGCLLQMPKEKLVVGIPFYTRIWDTKDGKTTSRAVGMQAAVDQLNADRQNALWNEDCGQYVAAYEINGTNRQIWFEEENSITAKMTAIKDAQVAGVAEWKLGLEKSAVWGVIKSNLE